MNLQRLNKILGILLLVFCTVGAIWGVFRQNSLKKNHKIGTGITTDYTAGGRGNAGGIWIDFVLTVGDKKYKGSSSYQTSEISGHDLRHHILNKNFPVVYNPSNPSVSSLLITPKDFSRFGYPFPDTLRWVLQYFKGE
jgi:hypothetical protein